MPKSDHDRENPVEPSPAKVPEHLVERFAPLSRDPVVILGGHLLQMRLSSSFFTFFINIGEPPVGCVSKHGDPGTRKRRREGTLNVKWFESDFFGRFA
jgi:hypothetical protein